MIDTAALRIKILKQAMSGNLSEQKNEDGEAVPKGIVVSDSSTDENAYVIPSSWRWVRVKDVVAKDVGGGTPSKVVPEYWDNGDISWATVKDFSNSENGLINETIDHITQEGLENSSANMVDEEAIVVCMRMALGKIVRVSKPMAINQDLRALWLKTFVEQDYFVYFYKTLKVEGRGTTVAGIKKDELMNYAFPVPPVKEQRRIIEKVNSIFKLLDIIDDLQLQYASDLEVLKSKIIDAGIQGKLTEQLPEDGTAEELLEQITEEKKRLVKEKKIKKGRQLPEIITDDKSIDIPDNWTWVRLGDISQIYGGKRIPAGRCLTTENTGHKYIRVSEMKNRTVLTDSLMYVPEDIYPSISRYIINKEDVYITVAGTIGRVGTIPEEIDGANLTENADRVVFRNLNKDWLVSCLDSSFVQKQIAMVTTQVAQPKLAIKRIEELVIPLPPFAEQERIAAKIVETLNLL